MYVPPQFQELDADRIAALIEVPPLAGIVAQTEDGLIANHIPVLRAPGGGAHRSCRDGEPDAPADPGGGEVLAI